MAEEVQRPEAPREPIDRVVDPLVRFMHVESAGGVVLAACAALALFLANSGWADAFVGIWKINRCSRVHRARSIARGSS